MTDPFYDGEGIAAKRRWFAVAATIPIHGGGMDLQEARRSMTPEAFLDYAARAPA